MSILGTYERKARLYPMLLVLLPLVLGVASWIPTGMDLESLLGGSIASAVLAAFFSQIARDHGKKCEPDLFQRWGGKPSVVALSYEGKFFDSGTLDRIHRSLHHLDERLVFPENAEDETIKRDLYFATYESASEFLLGLTRDQGKFPLVFNENVNYGYRRNLWAMKWPGLLLSSLGSAASIWRIVSSASAGSAINQTAVVGCLAGIVLGVFWLLHVREDWVRITANEFARQLCLAAQTLKKQDV